MELVSLEKFKKENSDDAADWGPIDALKRAIEVIESGEFPATMLVVAMARPTDCGYLERYRVLQGCSHLEGIGLMQQNMFDMMNGGNTDDDAE